MLTFYSNCNNGVRALVSSAVADDMEKQAAIRNRIIEIWRKRDVFKPLDIGLMHLGTPTFTFSSKMLNRNSPWLTGDNDLYVALVAELENQGYQVVQTSSIFVPFSNGTETGSSGFDAMAEELRYVTTSDQFTATFGISIDALKAKMLATK